MELPPAEIQKSSRAVGLGAEIRSSVQMLGHPV